MQAGDVGIGAAPIVYKTAEACSVPGGYLIQGGSALETMDSEVAIDRSPDLEPTRRLIARRVPGACMSLAVTSQPP